MRRVIEAKRAHGLPKLTKLVNKQAPQPTHYTDNALVMRSEQKRLQTIKAEETKKRLKLDKATAAQAVIAVTNQPELADSVGHGVGAPVQPHEAPHVTHDIRHIVLPNFTAIFCNVCGRWSKRNAHSKLTDSCDGETSWKGGLKLLRNGILPVKGARLPQAAKVPPRTKK